MAYKRGQEVFRDPKPFSYFVFPKYRKIVCDWCLKMCENEGILKACTKCKWVYYCNQTCQKNAWKSHHKLECKYLQTHYMTNIDKTNFSGAFEGVEKCQELYLELLRTTLKLKNNGNEEYFQLPNGKKRYFADLVSNADELRKQDEIIYQEFYAQIFPAFKILLGDDAIQSFDEFFEIYGKWRTNGTGIMPQSIPTIFKEQDFIGRGFYLGYSCLDHSCAPNAHCIYNGKGIVVRTIEDVENFSDLRITYFDPRGKTHERRKYLRENYFFDCNCARCEDPNSDAKFASLKCKSCPGWVHESTKICSSCHQTLKLIDEELNIVEKYKNGTLPKFEPTMTIKEIKSLLEKYTKIFHGFHKIFKQCVEVVLKSPIFALQCQKKDYDADLLWLELRKLWLNYSYGFLPKYHQDFVFFHCSISEACLALKLFDEAEFHLKKAEEICKMAYGKDHPYMQECQERKMRLQFARVLALK